jgi:FKBP-type peptidyl-prolyl cis-trans isomerase SlyD
MQISKNAVVSLTYTLRADHAGGEILQVADEQQPLEFLFGHGQLLPAFEHNINGLIKGNDYAFTLTDEEGYGPFDPESILDVDREVFGQGPEADEILFEGNVIPLQDDQGRRFEGRIMRIGDNSVKMDFNHPLAGKTLHFSGRIMEVRAATPEEVSHGHVHGPHGHHH